MNRVTYQRTRKLIELTIKSGEFTENYLIEMKDNLDLFRLGKRITPEEHLELTNTLLSYETE